MGCSCNCSRSRSSSSNSGSGRWKDGLQKLMMRSKGKEQDQLDCTRFEKLSTHMDEYLLNDDVTSRIDALVDVLCQRPMIVKGMEPRTFR